MHNTVAVVGKHVLRANDVLAASAFVQRGRSFVTMSAWIPSQISATAAHAVFFVKTAACASMGSVSVPRITRHVMDSAQI